MNIHIRIVTAVTLVLLASVAAYSGEMNHDMHSAKTDMSGHDEARAVPLGRQAI